MLPAASRSAACRAKHALSTPPRRGRPRRAPPCPGNRSPRMPAPRAGHPPRAGDALPRATRSRTRTETSSRFSIEHLARQREKHLDERLLPHGSRPLAEEARRALSGEEEDLEQPDGPRGVRRADPIRALAVEEANHPDEEARPAARSHRLESAPQLVVPARPLEEPAEEGAHVEARASRQDGKPPAPENLLAEAPRFGGELPGAPGLPRVARVDEVVRHARPERGDGLRRPGVEAAVDRERVGRDDLAAEPLGEGDRELRLARRRRAHDRKHAVRIWRAHGTPRARCSGKTGCTRPPAKRSAMSPS